MDEPIQLDIKVEEEQILCQYYQPNITNSSNIQLERSFEVNKQGTKDGAKDIDSISTLSTNDCNMNNDDYDDDEEHECTVCARLFQSEKQFKAHIKEHAKLDGLLSDSDEEEDFQTIEDPDTKNADHENIPSEKKKSAQVHKNAEESPYKYLHCPKKYATKDRLQTHVNRHKKGRRYECENISKCFPYPSQLENHKRTHTDERPYECDLCSRAFINVDQLNFSTMLPMKKYLTTSSEFEQTSDNASSQRLSEIERKLEIVLNNQNKILTYLERLTIEDFPKTTYFPVASIDDIYKVDQSAKTEMAKFVNILTRIIQPNGLIANFNKILSEPVLVAFNFDGVNGKKCFKDLKFLNKALLEACFTEGFNTQDYTRQIRTAFRVYKNRVFKKQYDSRRKQNNKASQKDEDKQNDNDNNKSANMSLDTSLQ